MVLDLLLVNCRMHGITEDSDTLGIKNGRIVYVGKDRTMQSKKTLDLGGSFVLPGFIDSHTHMLRLGLEEIRLKLDKAKSKDDTVALLKAHLRKRKNGIVIGYGWDESFWPDHEYITREDIDFTQMPVILFRRDGHMATVNSKLLSALGRLDIKSGILKEEDLRLIDRFVAPDDEEMKKAISKSEEIALSLGVTAVRDMQEIRTMNMISSMRTRIRFFGCLYDREYRPGREFSRTEWGIKCFLDGSIGARTAAHRGWSMENLKFDSVKFQAFVRSMHQEGLPIAAHAIGEIANDVATKALAVSRGKLRNSVEHFELVDDEIIGRLNNNLVASSQPNFLQWSRAGGLYQERLGSPWWQNNNPFREILDMGKHLAFGSDCMPFSPSYGIYEAVNAPHIIQRIGLDEAIRCYTEEGAYLLGLEGLLGMIRVGYFADLAVFPENYRSTVKKEEFRDSKSLLTIVEGNIEHSSAAVRVT
ncbi:amidohydrolase [Thermoplasmatales archaeon AK]|nr:amidohydrolase [Thermoplasmatales archaeon AK]